MKLSFRLFPFREVPRGKLWYVFLLWILSTGIYAQEPPVDSLGTIALKEVVVISADKKLNYQKQRKPLGSIDEFLESARSVNMVKRGAYAWEPILNDMESQRLTITIDGMQIFGACTDKMDPVTSYVDVSNLNEVQIQSGQQGTVFGNTIGGGINLNIDKGQFRPDGWTGAVESAYESNNHLRIFGGELNYSDEKFYLNTDGIYRKADNYTAGGNREIQFSQFEKVNFSVNTGLKISDGRSLSASFIFDRANDVGYPALTMDVSLARAFIGSLSFKQDTLPGNFSNWETKVYYNNIKHVMDDTKRPDVPIHMDMPGWSETLGFYSQAGLTEANNHFLFKLDGFFNQSLAEMTMYPQNSEEPPMFMLTWPDVHIYNLGFYAEDELAFKKDRLKLSTRLSYHYNYIADDFGLKSLKIFYPAMERDKPRFLKSFSAGYRTRLRDVSINGSLSYGERAPSVSEGYGFYLFNSFDNHDYVGDPDLETERSVESNLSFSYKKPAYELTVAASYFQVYNYIIGKVDPSLKTMTIGAEGVKIYTNLESARLFNTSLSGSYAISEALDLTGSVSYHRGVDDEGENLPLISPLAYTTALEFDRGQISASLSAEGAGEQTNYNPAYGETKTASYAILSASLGKRFFINADDLFLKAGVDNLFDTYYSAYTDWNNIPRMGRNFYLTITYSIN